MDFALVTHGLDESNRVTSTICNALESKLHCLAIFLNVRQASDKVWISGLLYEVSQYLPAHYIQILESYLHNRELFYIHFGEADTTTRLIKAGVLQGSVLGPLLYTLYMVFVVIFCTILVIIIAWPRS